MKGVTRADHKANNGIRNELKIESVLLEAMEKKQLGWFRHLVKMESKRPVNQIWDAKIVEKT